MIIKEAEKSMNILYIEHYAGGPSYGMEFRPYYLAREWVRQGHNVTIIASTFSHLRQRNPDVAKDFQEECLDGIKYVWLKGNEYEGSVARIRNIMSFVRKLLRNARRIAESYRPDLVIASSTYPLDNIPANKIAKLAGAKYIYEIHDLWPLSPMLIGGYSKYHPFIVVMQYGEDYAFKHADKVVSLLWNSEDHCRERGLAAGKFVCVPNGYNPEEWAESKFELALPQEHQEVFEKLSGKVLVGFAGGFTASESVLPLVKAAALLKNRPDIHFVLVGKGSEQASYEKVMEEQGLANVTILPSVPKSLVPAVDKHFDISYLGGTHSELHKYGTSYNKMTDYMLCSSSIIQSVDEPGSVVERIGCGIRVEAENVAAIADAIGKLADMSPDQRKEMGKKGKEYVKDLPWSKLAKDFLSSIER